MKRKKIIWVDIGSHQCQEYKAVFGSNFYFSKKLLFRRLSSLISRRRKFIAAADFYKLIVSRSDIKNNRKQFHVICVEANHNLLRDKIYKKVNDIYCVALNKSTNINIQKLYLAHNDVRGEGSSIFPHKENVSEKTFVKCIGIDAVEFAKQLKQDLDSNFGCYNIVLRLNCEGVEDDVIYSFHQVFQNSLKLISGSLNDVEGVKGKKSMEELENYLRKNQLTFTRFSGDVTSWPAAFRALKNFL